MAEAALEFVNTNAQTVEDFEKLEEEKADTLLREVSPKPDWRILELGCGIGAVLDSLQRRFPDCEYSAVDISESMIKLAKERLAGRNISFRVGNGFDLAFAESNSFHFAYAMEVFIHIQDWSTAKNYLREIGRILIKDGYFWFDVRYFNVEKSFGDSLGGKLSKFMYRTNFWSVQSKWKPSFAAGFAGLLYRLQDLEALITDTGLGLKSLRFLRTGNTDRLQVLVQKE